MKKYIVECVHDIYIDSFSKGQEEHVNYYETKGNYEADNAINAIKSHLNSLGYNFEQKNSEVDEDEPNKLFFSNLVDSESNEAQVWQIQLWKNDELKLYDNNMVLFVYETIPAKI